MPIRRADQRAKGYELPTRENSRTRQFYQRTSYNSWLAREPWGEAKGSTWHSGRASQDRYPGSFELTLQTTKSGEFQGGQVDSPAERLTRNCSNQAVAKTGPQHRACNENDDSQPERTLSDKSYQPRSRQPPPYNVPQRPARQRHKNHQRCKERDMLERSLQRLPDGDEAQQSELNQHIARDDRDRRTQRSHWGDEQARKCEEND